MMAALKYLRFGMYITATFLMWLLVVSILTTAAPLVGFTSPQIFETLVSSTSGLAFLIVGVIVYYHRRVFHRDVLTNSDAGHLIVIASVAFLPVFIYLTGVTIIEQMLRSQYLSLTILGDLLRHNFMVIVPTYFITLLLAGLIYWGLLVLLKKILRKR